MHKAEAAALCNYILSCIHTYIYFRVVTVHRSHGSVCASILGSSLVQQEKSNENPKGLKLVVFVIIFRRQFVPTSVLLGPPEIVGSAFYCTEQ